jgi:hypothetical protein
MTVRNLDDLLPPIDWGEPKARDATAGETAPIKNKHADAGGAAEGEIEAEIAKDAAAGEIAPAKDKLADAGGAVEGDIEAEIAKIVEETVKPSKP